MRVIHTSIRWVFHWNPNDSKCTPVYSTLLNILANLNNAVVRMAPACPQNSNSSKFLTKKTQFDLGIVPSAPICFLNRFSLLIRSNWVFFVFLPQRSWIGWKITINYFYFLTNFIAQKLLFSILKKILAPITSGECSRGC